MILRSGFEGSAWNPMLSRHERSGLGSVENILVFTRWMYSPLRTLLSIIS